MDEERMQRMMSDPNVQQSMNEALNNPDFVNMLIESNPMLRNIPNAREIISSPFVRQMMSNPQMMSQAMRMQRSMGGGESSFPAPGATDTTPEGDAATAGAGGQANEAQMPFNMMNPFADPNRVNLSQLMQMMEPGASMFTPAANREQPGSGTTPGQTSDQTGATPSGNTPSTQNQAPANPFAALFPPQTGTQANPFGMNPEMMQQMMQMLGGGGGGGAAPAPADTRPPEDRYAEQLRQLNDMGFYDFDRNVAALRRSGGSVQGAVEYLLTATD